MKGWRSGSKALLVAMLAATFGLGSGASALASTDLLPYRSDGYRYQVVSSGSLAGFEAPGFDDSSFSTGAAAFGTGGGCPLDPTVATFWPTFTDLLIRRVVTVPAGVTGLSVGVAIDNDVQVFWNGTLIGGAGHDGCAARDSSVFAVPAGLIQSGDNLLALRATDRGGESYFDAAVRVTASAPVITASATSKGAPYSPGTWTNGNVVVGFHCTAAAGVHSVTPPVTVAAEGTGRSVTGTCTDLAGGSASATFAGIDIDHTPPAVAYSEHPATYDVDQRVRIACTASDALSGLATDTCQDITGPAYAFPAGPNTFTATASDLAGNSAIASTTFSVVPSAAGLCRLVEQVEPQAGIATSLCVKLSAAAAAEARGERTAHDGALAAFAHEVAAQQGVTLTAADAALLTSLAAEL